MVSRIACPNNCSNFMKKEMDKYAVFPRTNIVDQQTCNIDGLIADITFEELPGFFLAYWFFSNYSFMDDHLQINSILVTKINKKFKFIKLVAIFKTL